MSEAGKRKRKETRPEPAARISGAPPKRYQPPVSFKQITDKPLVPPATLQDRETELWLIQLPPQLDPASLDGVTWKVRPHVADGELGHLQTPEGDSYTVTAEPEVLAKQLCVVVPSAGEGQESVVRQCARHVSLVKRWPKACQQEIEEGTPAALTNGAGEDHMEIAAEQGSRTDKQLTIAEVASAEPSTKKKKKKKKVAEEVQT